MIIKLTFSGVCYDYECRLYYLGHCATHHWKGTRVFILKAKHIYCIPDKTIRLLSFLFVFHMDCQYFEI